MRSGRSGTPGISMSRPPHAPHAFTLLELLVVVAVIGLLLAILLPALSAANEAGRAAVCGTNLNQLGIGSFAYAQANDGRLPYYPGQDAGPRRTGMEWWVTQVARGMDEFEPGIYRCPTDPTPLQIRVYVHNGTAYMADRPVDVDYAYEPFTLIVSYRGSCQLIEPIKAQSRDKFPSRRITFFKRPDKAIQLVEGISASKDTICYFFGQLEALAGATNPNVPGSTKTRTVKQRYADYASWERHFGTTNVLFIDGHVASNTPAQVGELALGQEYGEDLR